MASAGWAWMSEVAGEELAKLEAAHPGRLGPLKAELERLVADPGFDAAALLPLAGGFAVTTTTTDTDGNTPASSQPAPSPTHLICTQESSSQKRKLAAGGAARERDEGKRRRRRRKATPPGGAKDSAEMAIERAERCLERIRDVKQSLLAAWIH